MITVPALVPLWGQCGQFTGGHAAGPKCRAHVGPTIWSQGEGPSETAYTQPKVGAYCGHTAGPQWSLQFSPSMPHCAYSVSNVPTVYPLCPHFMPTVCPMCPQCAQNLATICEQCAHNISIVCTVTSMKPGACVGPYCGAKVGPQWNTPHPAQSVGILGMLRPTMSPTGDPLCLVWAAHTLGWPTWIPL